MLISHPNRPLLFFFQGYGHHRDLHSFPTRRSSDLLGNPVRIGEGEQQTGLTDLFLLVSLPCLHVQPELSPPYIRRRSEEHTSELQSHVNLVCRLLLEKKKPRTPPAAPSESPSLWNR